jgi:hypothetical protein
MSVQPREDIMANLGKKNGIYLARFHYGGKEYKKSLKTTDRKAAEAAMHRVEDALHRLAIQIISVPGGVDPGDFILTGGTLQRAAPQPKSAKVPSLDEVVEEYTSNLGHLATQNVATIRTHLRNLKKKLGPKAGEPLDRIGARDLEAFLQARLRERSATTLNKERVSVMQFFEWVVAVNYLAVSPAARLTQVKPAGDLPPFRTYQEIETIVRRGGLSPRQILRLWDCLYLSPGEVGELLALVRSRSVYDVTPILHATPAYTGMRRGEVMRLRWSVSRRRARPGRAPARRRRRVTAQVGWPASRCGPATGRWRP